MNKSLKEILDGNDLPVCCCDQIGSSLNFMHDSLAHCCSAVNAQSIPIICEFSGGLFPSKKYMLSFKKFTLQNILQKGECTNCNYLYIGHPKEEFVSFKYISLNHFGLCNLSCSYCKGDWRKNSTNPYDVVPTFYDLYEKGYMNKETLVAWGGGEPSLYEYVDETVKFCVDREIPQHIDTTAVKFSETFANALSSGSTILRVSPDAGTQDTYKKVKGADRFFEVWENILRYNNISNIRVKYILTPENLNEEDIYGFIKMCVIIGINHIYISAELIYYKELNNRIGNEKERELYINSAVKLYNAAISSCIKPDLLFWTPNDVIQIIASKF